jgi:hypothetical protein
MRATVISELLPTTRPEPARRLWLPFLLPSQNDLESARGRTAVVAGDYRKRWNGYNEIKRQHQDAVIIHARSQRVEFVAGPLVAVFVFMIARRSGDPDGMLAGAAKIVLDALQPPREPSRAGARDGRAGAGVIHCDGQHCFPDAAPIGVLQLILPKSRERPGTEVRLYEVVP